jgi:hypothetical protein
MMSKLLTVALAAGLGFAVSTPLYAAETSQSHRSAAWSDAEVKTALNKCNHLTATPQARCIVNIRRTPAADKVAMTSSPSADMVKDGTPITEAEYAVAVKECESVDAAEQDRCISAAKEHFGRM